MIARALPLVFLLSFGCGSEVNVSLKSVASGAILASNGYRFTNAYDKEKQAKIVERARRGDPNGAETEHKEYTPKRDVALKALDILSASADSGFALVPVFGQVLNKEQRKKLAELANKILKASADVISALNDAGIKVPSIGGAP